MTEAAPAQEPAPRADGALDLEAIREAYEERAAILEFEAGMTRAAAEEEARRQTGYEGW
jgi:hypothetical protein